MVRRWFGGSNAATPFNPLAGVEKLLAARSSQEVCELGLKQAVLAVGAETRGYVVLGSDLHGYHFAAVQGYDSLLLNLKASHGPWREPGPRLISNLIQELFTPNTKELRDQLGELGLRHAASSLVVPLAEHDKVHGALVLHRHGSTPLSDDELKHASQWGRLIGHTLGPLAEAQLARRSLVEFTRAFVQASEAQEFSQLGHAERVTAYALALGRALGLNRSQLSDLYFAAMLHDIGKLGNANLALENSEHPARGANLVASAPLLTRAAEGIKSHHERWDGTGFPQGLRGEAIPLLGRIVAVADAFDLLSSERGQALPLREVEKALDQRAGYELEPTIVTLLINLLRKGRSTSELARLAPGDLPF